MKDEKYGEDHIISKLQKKGFECLSLEEMAVTLISPTFEAEYNLKTGGDWNSNFKSKAVERLNRAKFDINWMNKKANTAFALFFDLVAKGDTQRCLEFIRKNAQYSEEIINSVDQNQKNPLHIAAKNGHYSLVSTLIGKGFSVFVRDKFLRTPLHLASQFGHATVVDILIKSKSDIYAKDSCGRYLV
jgi:ankyrin repeat protein